MTHAEELEHLSELHRSGDLTDEEFAAEKKRLIESAPQETHQARVTAPVPKPKSSAAKKGCLGILGLFAVLFIYVIAGPSPSGTGSKTNTLAPASNPKEDAYYAACSIVRNFLKSPSSADFVSPDDDRVIIKDYNDGSYGIAAPFEAKNAFGTKLASHFSIIVRKSGNSWNADAPPQIAEE